MAKFLFVVPPFTGHINPTLSIGEELIGQGHDVAWFGMGEYLIKHIPSKGRCFVAANEYSALDKTRDVNQITQAIRNVQQSHSVESFKLLYEDVLVPLSRYYRPALLLVIDQFQPDLIINDQQAFAGAICAIEKGIPYATSVTAPAAIQEITDLPKIAAWEQEQIISLQQEAGITRKTKLVCSELLTLVFSSHALMGRNDFAQNYKFVGPAIKNRSKITTSFDGRELSNRKGPKVLITLGTFIDGLKRPFFSKVIEALKDQPITVIAVSDPSLIDIWPANFIVKPYISQLEVLAKVDAVVCHGGHNTVCEALLYGLPLIVLPYATDQFNVASQVIKAGCGIRLKHSRLTSNQLRDSVWEILRNNAYRKSAEVVRRSFIEAGGTEMAVELLEKLIHEKMNVTA